MATRAHSRTDEVARIRAAVRASLEELRDRHLRVASDGTWWKDLGPPRALDPKSAAWRQMQALAQPLLEHERRDLELSAAIVGRWLSLLDDSCSDQLVSLMADAVAFAKAEARIQSALGDRIDAPDRHDASRLREVDRAQRLAGKKKRGQTKSMTRLDSDAPHLSDAQILKAEFDRKAAQRAAKKSRVSDVSLREQIGKARGISEDTVRRRIKSVTAPAPQSK